MQCVVYYSSSSKEVMQMFVFNVKTWIFTVIHYVLYYNQTFA